MGTGSSAYGLKGRIVYAMQVAEALTYDAYWADPRFAQKRPVFDGSVKQAFGDNIYHRNPKTDRWMQINSHHSFENGKPNPANIKNDTQTSRVLIGTRFIYWGASGPLLPKKIKSICAHRGHKCNFPTKTAEAFVAWLESRGINGLAGIPSEFPRRS